VAVRYGHGERGTMSISGVWGLPPVGSRGKAPGQGFLGRSPLKLEHISQ